MSVLLENETVNTYVDVLIVYFNNNHRRTAYELFSYPVEGDVFEFEHLIPRGTSRLPNNVRFPHFETTNHSSKCV